MSVQSSPSDSRRSSIDVSGVKVKKFMNGWTKEQEVLMAEWSDIAACYRWLHDKAEKKFTVSNMNITIPVIILSTLTGAANFAVGSIVPADNRAAQQYVGVSLGALSIFAGILTTLGNFFQYAQKSEAHRVCSIAWGKFQRLVQVELAISPMDRIEAMDFLKICRQDLDRLIEQSPGIPDDVIKAFETEFDDIGELKRPDICHGLEHTRVFDASKVRLAKVAADAMLHLRYKKNILSQAVIPELEKKIQDELNTRLEQRIKELMHVPVAESDSTSIVNLETDWRALLVKKKYLHTPEIGTPSGPAPVVVAVSPPSALYPPSVVVSPAASLMGPPMIISPSADAYTSPSMPEISVDDESEPEPEQEVVRLNIVGTDGPPSTSSNSVVSEPTPAVRPLVSFD